MVQRRRGESASQQLCAMHLGTEDTAKHAWRLTLYDAICKKTSGVPQANARKTRLPHNTQANPLKCTHVARYHGHVGIYDERIIVCHLLEACPRDQKQS